MLPKFRLGALLIAVLILAGCGGGSENNPNANVDVGTGTGDALADTSKTISTAMGSAFQGMSAGIADSSQTIQCSPDGQAVISGDASGENPISFDLMAELNDCAGLNGSLAMSGEYSTSSNGFSANFILEGVVGGNGCAVSLNGLGAEISQSGDVLSFMITGSVTATCGSATLTCSYNADNSQDSASLEANCNCSGSGC